MGNDTTPKGQIPSAMGTYHEPLKSDFYKSVCFVNYFPFANLYYYKKVLLSSRNKTLGAFYILIGKFYFDQKLLQNFGIMSIFKSCDYFMLCRKHCRKQLKEDT